MEGNMEAFRKDKSGATMNPMFIHKGGEASREALPPPLPSWPMGKTNACAQKNNQKFQLIVRFLLFLVAPIVYIWHLEGAYIQSHLLALTYIQIIFIIVFQGVVLRAFYNRKKHIGVIMFVASLGFIVTCCICSLSPKELFFVKRARSHDCGKCGECVEFTKSGVLSEMYPSFFPRGKDHALGISALYNGKRLSGDEIKSILGNFKMVHRLLSKHFGIDSNCTFFKDLLVNAIVGPCNEECEASKLSAAPRNAILRPLKLLMHLEGESKPLQNT